MNTPADATPGVDLLLMWHMHQPDYRDQASGEFAMPWVYLHALKDYSDMAWHLEQQPGMRAVVNFVPVLLDQLDDYCDQFATGRLRDPLLRLLARSEATALSAEERAYALEQCFRADHPRLIAPFAPYKRLFDLHHAMQAQGPDSLMYLSDRYLYDLVTWYHLSWTGESVRRESELIAQLMAKGAQFTEADRRALLEVVAEQVRQVVPRYRALSGRGQVELTTTPHCHPLAPLMLDFRSAHDALPEAPLPQADHYPGGEARVCAHLDSALASHARRFGAPPVGMWPAEGALSSRFAALVASRGLGWTASSQGVLGNSLRASGLDGHAADGINAAHRPYRASTVAPGLLFFFRDDRLSDLIGFVYSKWHGRDAALNFVHELEAIARAGGTHRPMVSVILDGENAWEYYPYNGFFFLCDLYRGLSHSPLIRTRTGADVVRALAGAKPSAGLDATAPGKDAAAMAPDVGAADVVQGVGAADVAPGVGATAVASGVGASKVASGARATELGSGVGAMAVAHGVGPAAVAALGADAAVVAAPGVDAAAVAPGELPVLAAGSWVYGNLATWIGARDKNRAWDLLCEAKAAFDLAMADTHLDEATRTRAVAQLADCEASDWFWWPGEDNPGESVSAFEALFRRKLANLYRILGVPEPASLASAFSSGAASSAAVAETGGTMRRGSKS